MTPSRRRISLWATSVASVLALLTIVASSLVAAPALAHPRPSMASTSGQTTRAQRDPRTLAHQLEKSETPAQRAAALAKVAKLPKWKPNARIVTSTGTTRTTARSAAAPNLAVPVTTDPNNWTDLGPGPFNVGGVIETGEVAGVAASATDPTNLWLSSYGSIWHSTNGGTTWTKVADGGSSWIVVDPQDANEIISGQNESTDGGTTWHTFASTLTNIAVLRFAIDPTNDQTMLAAGFDQSGSAGGVWRSTDGGTTWTQTLTDNSGDEGTDIAFDPANPAVAYAALGGNTYNGGTAAGGVYQSTDYGASWTLLAGGPTGTSVGLVSLALSHDGARLYVAAADATSYTLLNSSLYVYDTTAATWTVEDLSSTPVAGDFGNWNTNNVIASSPADASDQTVYLGSSNLYRSTDGGVNWTQVWQLPTPENGTGLGLNALTFPSSTTGDFMLATGEGVWSYVAGTDTWADDNATLTIGQVAQPSYGDLGPDSPLATTAWIPGYSVARYPAGSTGLAPWLPVTDPNVTGNVTLDWSNNANVYSAQVDCSVSPCVTRVYKSSTGTGGTFTPTGLATTDTIGPWIALTISPVHPQTLFLGTTRLWRTTDAGATWTTISPPLDTAGATCTGPSDPNCATIVQIVVAPTSDNTILIQYYDGEAFATTDGGASWYSVPNPCQAGVSCTNSDINQFAISPSNPQVFYSVGTYNLTLCGRGCEYGPTGVFVSTNAGHNWALVPGSAALPSSFGGSTGLAISPANPNLFVVTTGAATLISFDGGLDWMAVAGLPTSVVWYDPSFELPILFSHDGSQLLIATYDRGILAIAMPHLTLSQQMLTLTTPPGSSPASQQVTLGNSGQGTLSWSTSGLPSWLAVSPPSGSIAPGQTQTVTLSFNTPSTTPQTYTTYLDFHTNADNPLTQLPVTVSSRLSKTWYFAEGYTGGSFTEYLTLANPNPVAANVSVAYLLQSGGPPVNRTYTVAAASRKTVNVNTELHQGVGVSMEVTSDQPIIAERPMYFTFSGAGLNNIPGGTDVLGATSLGTQFDFGYLDTSANHVTYLTVLNPLDNPMLVNIAYYPAAGGAPITKQHTVGAYERGTILVNSDVPAGSYSALVALTQNGLVERPMYLVDGTTGYTGAADVIGVQQPATSWAFAEGFTNTNFNERYLLSNPSTTQSAHATVTFLKTDGTTQSAGVTLAPGQQQLVSANSVLGNVVNNSATVTSDQPILAERFISFTYHGPVGASTPSSSIPGATDVLGASSTGQVYDFAEGYTGGSFGEYLTLENPNATTAQVTVAYLPQTSGAAPTIQTYFVGASSRYTVLTNAVMVGQSFSMVVLADEPIVAERPMYFVYNGTQTGGSDVVGYQP